MNILTTLLTGLIILDLYLKMDVLYGMKIGCMEYYFLMEHLQIILSAMD